MKELEIETERERGRILMPSQSEEDESKIAATINSIEFNRNQIPLLLTIVFNLSKKMSDLSSARKKVCKRE